MEKCGKSYNPSEHYSDILLMQALYPAEWRDMVLAEFTESDAQEIIEAVKNGLFTKDFQTGLKKNNKPYVEDSFKIDDYSDLYSEPLTDLSVEGFYYAYFAKSAIKDISYHYKQMVKAFSHKIMSNLIYDLKNKKIIDITAPFEGTDFLNTFLTDYKIELIESLREVTNTDLSAFDYSTEEGLTRAINKILYDYRNIRLSQKAHAKYNDFVILSNFDKLLEREFDWIRVKPEYKFTSIHSRTMYESTDSKLLHRVSFENDKDESGKSITEYTSTYMKKILDYIPDVNRKGEDLQLTVGEEGFHRIITLISNWALNDPKASPEAHKEILKGVDADYDLIINEYLEYGLSSDYSTILVDKVRGIQKYIFGADVPVELKNLFVGQMKKTVPSKYVGYTMEFDPELGKNVVVSKDLRDRISDLQAIRLKSTMSAVVYNNQLNIEYFKDTFKDRISVDENGVITLHNVMVDNGGYGPLVFYPIIDSDTGHIIYNSKSTSEVDDDFTADLIYDLFHIAIPKVEYDNILRTLQANSLMDIFGNIIAITIGASHDTKHTKFTFDKGWKLNTSMYNRFFSNPSKVLSLLYGSEVLNVLKDFEGNNLPIFQLGSLFYDIKNIIFDHQQDLAGVYQDNLFVKNHKLLGELFIRNSADIDKSVTKAKQMSENDLLYFSIAQDFYLRMKNPKTASILLQPTCFSDKIRFAVYEIRTNDHKINGKSATNLFTDIAENFNQTGRIVKGAKNSGINTKKATARNTIINETAFGRQGKIKRQLVDVIGRLSTFIPLTYEYIDDSGANKFRTIEITRNSSYQELMEAVDFLHTRFKKLKWTSPSDIRAKRAEVNAARVANGLPPVSICESYDLTVGKSGFVELNEVLLNNAKLYWDWDANDSNTQQAFLERISEQMMAFAKVLHQNRFYLNSEHDPNLNRYFKYLTAHHKNIAESWINPITGRMKSFKLYEKGTLTEIVPEASNLDEYFDATKYDLELNPMIESYAYADMLYSNQINDILFGDVASYPNSIKAKAKAGMSDIQLVNQGEANRLVTMHKRTMVGGSTRHKMVPMPFGAPKKINIAVNDDVNEVMWDMAGNIAHEKTQDGCGFSSPYMTVLENWSYLDGAVGPNRKTIFAYNDPRTGVFTQIKWAVFDISNEARRRALLNTDYSVDKMFERMHSISIGDSSKYLDFSRFYGKDIHYSAIENYTHRPITIDTDVYWWNDKDDTYWKLNRVINNGDNTVTIFKQQVDERGKVLGEEFFEIEVFETIADLDAIFGGAFNMELKNNKLQFSDTNIKLISNIICEMDWKDKFAHYSINQSAVKVGAWNINNGDAFAEYQKGPLDTYTIDASYGGVQLDASSLAEDGDVAEMMQTVAALIQDGYRSQTVYDAYVTIGEIALDAMSDIIDARNVDDKQAIYEILGNAFIKSLTIGHQTSLGLAQAFVSIAEKDLLKKDIKFTLPFSGATIKPKFMSVVTSLTNKSGIRRRYSGLGTVQAPSYGYMKFYDFGNGQKLDYVNTIKHLKSLGIEDAQRALTDQKYALEKKLLTKITPSQIELEDTLVIRKKGYWEGTKVQIKSIQQYDFFKNLFPLLGEYEVLKWNGQPKNLRASETKLEIKLPTGNSKINLYDTDFIRAAFYVGDLTDSSRLNESSVKNIEHLASSIGKSFDWTQLHKFNFVMQILKYNVTQQDLDNTIDPILGTSYLDYTQYTDWQENLFKLNAPKILAFLQQKAQELNIKLSDVYNNRGSVEIPLLKYSFRPVKVVGIEFTPPEIMMSNSYKTALGITDGDNVSDITSPDYFINTLSGKSSLPSAREVDVNDYDALLTTVDDTPLLVSLRTNEVPPIVTSAMFQDVGDYIWYKGEKLCSSHGKTFGQYLTKTGDLIDIVIVDSIERLQELLNSNSFPFIRYNYNTNNWQDLLKVEFNNNFEKNELRNDIVLSDYATDTRTGEYLDNSYSYLYTIRDLQNVPSNIVDLLIRNERISHEKNIKKLANKKYDSFVESLNFIGARIPTQSMQSFSSAKVVSFIDTDTNEIYLPRIIAWLEGSDYDIDKWYLMGLSLMPDGSIANFSDLNEYFSYSEIFKLPLPKNRKFTFKKVQLNSSELIDTSNSIIGGSFKYSLPDSNVEIEIIRHDRMGEINTEVFEVKIHNAEEDLETTNLLINYVFSNPAFNDEILLGEGLEKFGFKKAPTLGFYKPDVYANNFVTTQDIYSLKRGEIDSLKNILINDTSELIFAHDIDDSDIKLVMKYLRRHERSKRSTFEKSEALKNKVYYIMRDITADPITQINLHTPISMDGLKEIAVNSILGNAEKSFSPDNPVVKYIMQLQNMEGKDVVGIGAVSLKAFFGASFYFNSVVMGIKEKLQQLQILKSKGEDTSLLEQNIYELINQIVFDSKFDGELLSLSNIYWKPILDLIGDEPLVLNVLETIKNPAATYLYTGVNALLYDNKLDLKRLVEHLHNTSRRNNAADSISAVVSAATDNAKELILSKINATSKFADIYTLLISTGMTFQDISSFMMSPIFNLVNSFSASTVFNSSSKFTQVDRVIRFILDRDAIGVSVQTFDNVIFNLNDRDSANTSFIKKLIYEITDEGGITNRVRKNILLQPLFKEGEDLGQFMHRIQKTVENRFSKTDKTQFQIFKDEFIKLLRKTPEIQAVLLKHLEHQIHTKKISERWDKYNDSLDSFSDSMYYDSADYGLYDQMEAQEYDAERNNVEMKYFGDLSSKDLISIYAFVEDYFFPKLQALNAIPDILLDEQLEKLKQLETILPAVEEQRLIGRLLGVNKGLKTDDFEEYSWIKSFDTFVNKKIKNLELDEAFDFLKFVSDKDYQKKFIDIYEGVKTLYNPLRIAAETPHFNAMLRLVELNRYLLENSAAVKLERKLAYEVLNDGHDKLLLPDKTTFSVLTKADLNSLTRKEFTRLKNYVTDVITFNWFRNTKDLKITIPAGQVQYNIDNNEEVLDKKMPVYLNTIQGLATFKRLMDTYIIPKLKQKYKGQNEFIDGLVPDFREDYRSNQPIFFYKPILEMAEVDSTMKTSELYDGMLQGFNELTFTTIQDLMIPKVGKNNEVIVEHLFPEMDTNWTIGELFFIYDLITNKNGFGNNSFARFFEDIARYNDDKTLVHKFYHYLSELDNGNIPLDTIEYDIRDLRIRMADLPGIDKKFGVKLINKHLAVKGVQFASSINQYGKVTWSTHVKNVEMSPSYFTFGIQYVNDILLGDSAPIHNAFNVADLQHRLPVTPNNKAVMLAAIERISDLFGSKIKVPLKTITNEDIDNMWEHGGEITFNDEQDYTMTRASKAFIHNGIIYVNIDKNFIDAPVHELLHVICAAMKINPEYKDLYYKWLENVKLDKPELEAYFKDKHLTEDSELNDYLEGDRLDLKRFFEEKYPNKKGSDLKEEVLVHVISTAFSGNFHELWGESQKLMPGEITKAVVDTFNQIFATSIEGGTSDDFLNVIFRDMLILANSQLFNPENNYLTKTSVPISQELASIKNKMINDKIIEYGKEC